MGKTCHDDEKPTNLPHLYAHVLPTWVIMIFVPSRVQARSKQLAPRARRKRYRHRFVIKSKTRHT